MITGILVNLAANGGYPSNPGGAGRRTVFPEIPVEVTSKFVDAIQINAPQSFHDVESIPLVEGFDALVYHFSRVSRCEHMRMATADV